MSMAYFQSYIFNKIVVPISFVASAVGTGLLIQQSHAGKKCPSTNRMDGKVIVVTGASSGIGKETAREIAKRGGSVIMACRHVAKCETVAMEIRSSTRNKHCVCKFLNLASFKSIKEFSDTLKDVSKIDVLINNAGVMKPRAPKTTPKTLDGIERQFAVNYLGPFMLTQLLLPKLKMSDDPRIINVAASMDAIDKGQIDIKDINKENVPDLTQDNKLSELYFQSKLALVLFTHELAKRLKSDNISVNCLNPGVASTNIGRYSLPPLYSPGRYLFKPFKIIMMKTPNQAAQTSIYLSISDEVKGKTGIFYENCEEMFDISSKQPSYGSMSNELWSVSKQLINERNNEDL